MNQLTFSPLTPGHWRAFEQLFGVSGACGGCWCMWWRVPKKEFDAGKGEGNRARMRQLVRDGVEPGVIALDGDEAVGWCALAPRADYPRLASSRVLRPLDDAAVWSVTCLFVKKEWRRRGVTPLLLREACSFAKARGATIVEGYPTDPKSGRTADAFAFTGLPSSFLKAGFTEVARGSETRPIMRRVL